MTCGIYRITENETGRHYIGQSKNIEKRWKGHHKRFPPNLFGYHIVITCLPEAEILDCLERFCIADFKAKMLGFNVTKGGNGAWGSKNPEETRRKQSAAHKGKLKPYLKGKPHSEETRRKQSEAHKGKPKHHSEETRRKMSEAARNRKTKKEKSK